MADGGEVPLEVGEERGLGAALKDLREEGAAGGEDVAGEGGGGLGEAHDAQVVGLPVAGRVGGHVGEDDVRRAAEALDEERGAVSSRKSSDDELGAGKGIDGQEVDSDDRRPPSAPPRA